MLIDVVITKWHHSPCRLHAKETTTKPELIWRLKNCEKVSQTNKKNCKAVLVNTLTTLCPVNSSNNADIAWVMASTLHTEPRTVTNCFTEPDEYILPNCFCWTRTTTLTPYFCCIAWTAAGPARPSTNCELDIATLNISTNGASS